MVTLLKACVFALVCFGIYRWLSPSQRTWLKAQWKYVGYVVGIIAVIGGLWWLWGLSWQAPAPGKVWELFKDYWLWMILAFAIMFFAANALPDSLTKAAQGVVAVVALTLVGAMIVHGIWGEKSSSQQVTRSEVPLASSPQSEWPPLSIPASGKKKIPILPGKRVTVAGYNFVLHTVYEDGRDCSGACPDHGVIEVYVENKSATENIVVYAYTPIQ